jgi:hypothetical protein
MKTIDKQLNNRAEVSAKLNQSFADNSNWLASPSKNSTQPLVSLQMYPHGKANLRHFSLFYFAGLLLVWNILGHTVLGFEQAWIQPFVGFTSACLAQLIIEWVECRLEKRPARYQGDWVTRIAFFLPAFISGIAVAMLLYPNDRMMPVVFGSVLSIVSKGLFRAPVDNGKTQHFFNPSNFGITVTLLFFPWVGVAPPYHFAENTVGIWDWLVPAIILCTGLFLHGYATKRLPLIAAWIGGFLAQAFIRHLAFGVPLAVPLAPMTSAAFIIFTLYMIPDPATTPLKVSRQILFGLAVAAIYGYLQISHLFFGLFIALTIISALRGAALYLTSMSKAAKPAV